MEMRNIDSLALTKTSKSEREETMAGSVGEHTPQSASSMSNLLSESGFRLPHKYESIIKQSDNIVDTSSISKFYEQLTVGIYLNGNVEKYWVTKHEDRYYNCFTIYADKILKPDGIVHDDFFKMLLDEYSDHWGRSIIQIPERDGTLVTAAEVKSSSRFIKLKFLREPEVERFSHMPNELKSLRDSKVERFFHLPKFEFLGCLFTRNLNLKISYEISFVVMLPEGNYARPISAGVSAYFFFEPLTIHQHTLHDKPRGEWIRLLAGRFVMPEYLVILFLDGLVPGMVIKGVVIEPVFDILTESGSCFNL